MTAPRRPRGGDDTFARPDLIDSGKAINAYVMTAGRYGAVTFFSPATMDQATSVSNAVLAV